MLVLSRKVREEIIIANTIRVVVLKVAGGKVKLGFIAPDDVAIHRKEIRCKEPASGKGARWSRPAAVFHE